MRFCFSQIKNWLIETFSCKRRTLNYQSELIERLSHEMRTSLTGVVGYSEFIESTSTEPMVNFTAKIIRESSQGLVRVSNSFFDLHRLELGQLQLDCGLFSISSLVRDVVRLYQKQAHEQGVSLVFACDDALLVDMYADERRVKQVVEALVFGTLQAAKKGQSIHVTMALRQDQHQMKLMINSTGALVDGSQIDLLQDFWSNHLYKFKLQEGPGVELALAKAMIYFLQGKAEYHASHDVSPKLTVTLPMHYRHTKVRV